jgi:hypothetical protein
VPPRITEHRERHWAQEQGVGDPVVSQEYQPRQRPVAEKTEENPLDLSDAGTELQHQIAAMVNAIIMANRARVFGSNTTWLLM